MDNSFIRSFVWLSLIGAAICGLLYLFVFDTWVIPSTDPMLTASIMPGLFPEDRILTQRGSEPRVGQLARCVSPEPGLDFIIGRVMATGGDRIEIRDERIIINGKLVPTRHQCEPVKMTHPLTGQEMTLACHVEDNGAWTFPYLIASEHPEGYRSATVEPGKLFLISDNRHIHKDSRDFGPVDASTCEHIVFRLWGTTFIDASRRFTVLY